LPKYRLPKLARGRVGADRLATHLKRTHSSLFHLDLPPGLSNSKAVGWSLNEPHPHPARVSRLLNPRIQQDAQADLPLGVTRIWFRSTDGGWIEATISRALGQMALALRQVGGHGLPPAERRDNWQAFSVTTRITELRSLGLVISTLTLGPCGHLFILHSAVRFHPPNDGCPVAQLVDVITPNLADALKQEHRERHRNVRHGHVRARNAALRFVPAAALTAAGVSAGSKAKAASNRGRLRRLK
jgi:hypothetical protein